MADLAFIFKISQWREGSLNPKWLPRIQEIKDAYQAFLATYSPAKAAYFSEYKYRGERVTDKLSFIKKALLDECSAVEDTYFSNPRDLLEKALIKLYCTKYDGRLDQLQKDQRIYGLPVQALFMALDNHNLVGCKSANERFFLTEGLTQTLQAFVEETLPEDDQRKMREKCKAFLREDEDCPPSVFIEFLMSTHNKLNAYGSAIGPSLLDTGTPKCDVDAHDWVEIKALMNTNVFAPGTYTNIAQMGVAQLQAHGDALPHRLEHELTHTDPRELYNEKMRVAAHAFYTGPGRDHPAGKPSERERRLELPLSSAFSHA
jgi:hypothetical protein